MFSSQSSFKNCTPRILTLRAINGLQYGLRSYSLTVSSLTQKYLLLPVVIPTSHLAISENLIKLLLFLILSIRSICLSVKKYFVHLLDSTSASIKSIESNLWVSSDSASSKGTTLIKCSVSSAIFSPSNSTTSCSISSKTKLSKVIIVHLFSCLTRNSRKSSEYFTCNNSAGMTRPILLESSIQLIHATVKETHAFISLFDFIKLLVKISLCSTLCSSCKY